MTSSFTSLALAALALGYADAPAQYLSQAERLCTDVAALFPGLLASAASLPYAEARRAVYLGSGCQYGAAREAALKLTEMTAGSVVAMSETHLGLRHGPMAAVDAHTLIISFTPTTQRAARYATDLVAELGIKALGCGTIAAVAGETPQRYEEGGVVTTPPGKGIDECFAAIENVVLGQAIGFFACREHGLRPDAPSAAGVIARVVPPFPIYEDLVPAHTTAD
jgi:tagatose-6-phosphate ketose/aldose isomerase